MNNQTNYSKQSIRFVRLMLALVIVFGVLTGCASQPAVPTAIPFPTRPITYIIPYDPGGPSDRIAQLQAAGLKRILGQDIVIDYKVGAGGATGCTEVAKSNPDGYTLVAANFPTIITQPMYGKVSYKTEQLDVIAIFARNLVGLAVLKSSPYNTLQDFLAAAKAEPGQFKLGMSSTLGAQHIAALLLQKMTGTKFELVTYTGAAPQMSAFLAGEIPVVMGNTDDFIKYKDQVKVLALASDARFPALPDAPTFKEQGLDLVTATERGVALPAGTPLEIVKKLEAAFLEVSKAPEFQAALKAQGFSEIVMGHAESQDYISKLIVTYKGLADFFK
jgi:tripartite-type tricarboxylate transporter receptor subunit TctC